MVSNLINIITNYFFSSKINFYFMRKHTWCLLESSSNLIEENKVLFFFTCIIPTLQYVA